MVTKRSNSSIALRKELAKNYTVPDIAPFVPIDRYYGAAKRLHDQAIKSVIAGDLVLSYKYLHNLITLLNNRIPKHPDYTKHNPNRAWSRRTVLQCIDLLEQVVERMDQLQDEANRRADEDLLIDTFDGVDIATANKKPSAAARGPAPSPSAPKLPSPTVLPIPVLTPPAASVGVEEGEGYMEVEDRELQPSEALYPPIPSYSSTVRSTYDR